MLSMVIDMCDNSVLHHSATSTDRSDAVGVQPVTYSMSEPYIHCNSDGHKTRSMQHMHRLESCLRMVAGDWNAGHTRMNAKYVRIPGTGPAPYANVIRVRSMPIHHHHLTHQRPPLTLPTSLSALQVGLVAPCLVLAPDHQTPCASIWTETQTLKGSLSLRALTLCCWDSLILLLMCHWWLSQLHLLHRP
jgi:hypothetical protein